MALGLGNSLSGSSCPINFQLLYQSSDRPTGQPRPWQPLNRDRNQKIQRILWRCCALLVRFIPLERLRGVEPPSPAWKAGILAVVRQPHNRADYFYMLPPSHVAHIPALRTANCHTAGHMTLYQGFLRSVERVNRNH